MIGYLLFGGIVILLAVAVVAAAVRSGRTDLTAVDGARARGDVAIEALRGLEFEFQTGKLSEEEYARLRRELELEAVRGRGEGGEERAGGPDRAGAGAEGDSGARGSACANCGGGLEGRESFCPQCGAALR